MPRLTTWASFLLIAITLLSSLQPRMHAATVGSRLVSTSSPEYIAAVSSDQADADVRPLESGKPIEREIAGGQSHFYNVMLAPDQYLHLIVDQRGIDVVVIVNAPEGAKIIEVDSPNGSVGPEDVHILASVSGGYRLEIRSLEANARIGKYEVRIEELRLATARDRNLSAAEKLYQEARLLTDQGVETSRQDALIKYKQALPFWRALDDRQAEADTLTHIADIYNTLNGKHDALDYYNQALPLFRALKNQNSEMSIVSRKGSIYRVFGENQMALEAFNEALTITRALDDRTSEARTLSNIATVYFHLGEAQRALYLFEQALALQQLEKDRRGEAITLNNIAKSQDSLGNKQSALDYFNQALLIQQETGSKTGQAAAHNNIGAVYYDLGDMEKALDSCTKALEICRALKVKIPPEAMTINMLGRIYAALGQIQKARDYHNEALQLKHDMGDKGGEALTIYDLARLERDSGNISKALNLIESAIEIVESVRAKIASQELRASYLASKQEYYEFYVNILMRLHRLEPAAKRDVAALEANERALARSLLETLSEAKAGIREGNDPVLGESERRLQQQINAKAAEQMAVLSGMHTKQQAESLAQELSTLTSEYMEVRGKIRVKSPRYAALTQPQPLKLNEIQRQILDPKTLLLEYALGDERSYLWAITADSITNFELPGRAEIEAAVRRFYGLLTERNRQVKFETAEEKRARITAKDAEYPAAALALSRMVLGPVAAQLGKKRLLIVAHGALQYVPFAALPKPVTITASEDAPPKNNSPSKSVIGSAASRIDYLPLMVDHEIVNLPSASTLAVLRNEVTGRKSAPKTVVVLADPVFDKSDKRLGGLKDQVTSEHNASRARSGTAFKASMDDGSKMTNYSDLGEVELARLPFTRREAMAILALVSKDERKVALDFEASRTMALSPELSQYRYVHFATHAFWHNTYPELNGIALSMVDKQGLKQNGFLRSIDIFNLKLGADLVVLSGCKSGLGKEIKGEGLMGLTRAFMYAGAQRVLVSLWDVSDLVTADLMGKFYEGMLGKERLSPAAALRAAQIAIWKGNRWQSPYYWAAFVLQGEPR
jgi:CHAT domain-containing protein/Tfp pilus assembly protein PilF